MSKYTLGDLTVHHWNDWDRVARDPMTVGLMITQGVGYSTAAALAAVGTWGFGTFAIGLIAVTAVTSWAISALTPKPDFSSLRGLLANTRDATSPQEVVYGEVRKGGVVTFMESTGDKNKFLHQIICLAGHEVNDIGDIYINDLVANPDPTTHLVGGDWNDKIYIRKFLGTSTQNVYGILSGITDGPEWKDGDNGQAGDAGDFRGQGIACLYVRMEYDQDTFAEGIPIFTAKVQGKKVLDPRTSTTAYSNNPALCIRDYLTSNYGLSDTGDINDTMFNAAANACDESVTLADSGTQTRYEMNGSFVLSKTPSAILADMMTSCAGTLFWGQGEWQLKVGEYTTPVKTFTLDDFRSGINLTTKHSRRDNFNIVRGTFIDADQDWVRADYPEIRSTSFISDDNGLENAIDLTLPFTTNNVMAQRLAKMTLFRSREQMTISADFGMEAFEVQVGDIVEITNERYGWNAKDFEVVGWKFSNSGDTGEMLINMTLRETSSAAFDWNAEESYITGNDSDLGNPASNLTVSGVTVTDKGTIQTDGTFVGQALVSWTQANNKFISHYEVEWKDIDESSYLHTQIEANESSVIIGPLETGTQYNVRVRAVTIAGIRGAWVAATPYTHGGDTTAPSPVTGLSATGGPQNVTLDWTAPTTDSDATTLYDLKGYNIYRNTTNSQPVSPIAFSGSDKYVDGGLSASTTFYYWVAAVDFTGNESTSVASGSVTTNPLLVDGADGASVLVVYADDAAGTNQSLSAGSRTFVQYYEYTGTAPSLPVTGTFVQFVGDDGTNGASIFPIYADDASGTNQSFSSTGKEYVTFYEATSQPTLPVTGQTFVKFVGDDGIGQDGDDGDTVATGRVYYNTLQQSTPSVTPSATGYNFSTGELTGLTSSYSQTQPAVDITSTTDYEWSASFTATKNGSTGTVTVSFGSLSNAIQVTTDLESDNYDGAGFDSSGNRLSPHATEGWHIDRSSGSAEFQNAIIRGTLNANDITAGTISAARIPTLSTAKFDIFTGDTIGINKGQDTPVNTGDVASVSFTPTSASTCIVQVSASITCPNANTDSTYSVGFFIEVNGTSYASGSTGTVFDGGNINPKPISIAYGFNASASTTYTIKCTFYQGYGRSKQVTATSGALTAIFTQA